MPINYQGSGGGVPRKTAHIFAKNAANNDVTVFGSTLAQNTQYTQDIADIQNNAFEIGWRNAVISNKNYPLLADMNGVQKTFSQQIAYILQHGLAQWDSATAYYTYDIVNVNGILYICTIDNNVNSNPTTLSGWAVYYDPDNYGANQDLSNLTTYGDDRLHALKGYEDKGELLTDTEGLADVTYYAHSTFDGSKFTGSLTVPNTGIASGFNSSDDLLTDYVFNPQGTWEIRGSFVTPSIGATETIITTTATYGTKIRIYDNYKIGFMASSNNSSYDIAPAGFAGANALSASTKYYFKFEFTGTQYILSTSTDNVTWTEQCKKDNTNSIYSTSSTNIRIGKANGQYEIFTGSIDLKQFSIKVDGVPVFSGNQTGIDTIKADNYTPVEPSPHDPIPITPDGIASGFSSTKYITTPTINWSSNDFEIYCTFTLNGSYPSGSSQNLFGFGTSNDRLGINITNNSMGLVSGGSHFTGIIGVSTSANKTYRTIISVKNSVVTFKVAEGSGDYVTYTTPLTTAFANNYSLAIGNIAYSTGDPFVDGTIDLNAFKIYVNGDLVYQPCLKIPYTLSKTGSKIVDVYARDRVNDMYEQFGSAPYYTLQEDSGINFTLIGKPTITNWVVSNFANNKYIQTLNIIKNANQPFEINFEFTTSNLGENYQVILQYDTNFFIVANEDTITFADGVGSPITLNAQTDAIYNGVWGWNGVQYYVKYSINGNPQIDKTKNSTTGYALNSYIQLGYGYTTHPFQGSINLKEFKVYINNALAYKVPIDPNFTIPQGELYGMLENIVESADDGNGNGYIVYNNGTCIQYGRSGSITTQNGTSKEITLTKSYKNSNFKAFGTINISTDFTGAFALYTVTTASNKFNLVIDGISVSSSHTFTCDWYTIGRI